MKNELLECPGCGAEAERDDSITKGVEGAVRCTECSFCALISDWQSRHINYRTIETNHKNNDPTELTNEQKQLVDEIFDMFEKDLKTNMKDLDPKISKLVDEHFEDLI